jgi:hypothetical protein
VVRLLIPLLAFAATATAQDAGNFRVELTLSGWFASLRGDLQAGGLPVDLDSDLALEDRWTFFGRLVLKPARKHRILMEGAPYRFEGRNTLQRTIVYAGRTYTISEDVASTAELTYVFGGYQYDFLSGPAGHLGIQGGVAYVDAAGEIRSVTRDIAGRHEERFPIPLAGVEGRVFVVPGRVSISGELKGMTLGPYGRFIQGSVDAGVTLGPVTFLAGYKILDSDVHEEEGGSGVRPRISGPIFSIQLRR